MVCLPRKDLQKYKEWKQEQSATKDKSENKNDTVKTSNDKTSSDEKDSDETGTNLKKAS